MLNKSLRPKTDKDFGAPPPGYVAGRGRGATGFASGVSRDTGFKPMEEKDGDLGDGNYDEFSGYGGSLFNKGAFDAEDNEADQIYDLVDARMESRRKKARDVRRVEEIEDAKSALSFRQRFTEYKEDLSKVSEAEWMALPEAQERLKSKKVKREFLQAVPDRLIVGDQSTVIDSNFSINEVGVAKQAVLSLNLDKGTAVSESVDPENYLGELEKVSSNVGDIGEIKKARLLFRSITKSDPLNATAWLALARLEEVAGNIPEAKATLASGIAQCASAEDLWLAAVRLETDSTKAKSIIANGIRQNPHCAQLWTQASILEQDVQNKKKVLQKAIEFVKPPNIDLWKGLLNLSEASETLLLLERAVQACPTCEEFWLMFSKLSSESQKILNQARRAIPTSVAIWVAAAELAARMNPKSVEPILAKGIESLASHGVVLPRKEWYMWAAKSGEMLVVKTIVQLSLLPDLVTPLQHGRPVKEVKHRIVLADWEEATEPIIKQSILETALFHVPELSARKGLWVKLLQTSSSTTLFEKSVQACPQAEVLWLMFGKFLWAELGDREAARRVIARGIEQIDDSEDLYLAMHKLVPEEPRWLEQGRAKCVDCERLWVKSAQVARKNKEVEKVAEIVTEGLSVLGESCFKLWLIAVHAFLEAGHDAVARDWAGKACEACPTQPAVWLVAADLAMKESEWSRARSILERGRIRNPNDENLWWKGLQVELQSGSGTNVFLSRALQACPTSGLLWSWAIALEPAATRHPKCLDALKQCQSDPLVVGAVAMFFWQGKQQFDKARKWFDNATKLDTQYGQVWANFFAFEISLGDANLHNTESLFTEIASIKEQPNKGIEWNQFVKRIDNWDNSFFQNICIYIAENFPEIHRNLSPKISELISSGCTLGIAKLVKAESASCIP